MKTWCFVIVKGSDGWVLSGKAYPSRQDVEFDYGNPLPEDCRVITVSGDPE